MSSVTAAPPKRCGLDHGVDICSLVTPLGVCRARAFLYPSGGALGIALLDREGEMQWVLSVNLPTAPKLEHGEFYAKTYSENEEVARLALAGGAFRASGRAIASGFVNVPVWSVVDPMLLEPLYRD
jgi:hypothetical protein